MVVLALIAYLMAGNFLMNGLLHLMMGLLGKKFTKCPKLVSQQQYQKVYSGRLFSSVVFNAMYGLGQIIVVLLGLSASSFRFGITWEAAALLAGAVLGTALLAWKYEGAIG